MIQSSVWERLAHNLTYSGNIIVYCQPDQPLGRFLPELQESFSISYQVTTQDFSETEFKRKLAQHITGALPEFGNFSLTKLLQLESKTKPIVIAIKGWLPEKILVELLEANQATPDNVKLVFEPEANQCDKFIAKLESLACSVSLIIQNIKPTSYSESSVKLGRAKLTKPLRKFSPTVFLVLVSSLLAAAISGFFIYRSIGETETKVVLPEKSIVETKVNRRDEGLSAALEIDKTKELASDSKIEYNPNMTAAEYFKSKAKANPSSSALETVKVTETLVDQESQLVKLNEPVARKLDTQAKGNTEPKAEPTAQIQEKINEQSSTEPKLAKAESSNISDNAWFLAQEKNSFVIQLSLISDKKLLNEYILDNNLTGKIKIYQLGVRFGVTTGLYASIADAQKGLKSLPEKLSNSGAFAKKISIIQKQISEK